MKVEIKFSLETSESEADERYLWTILIQNTTDIVWTATQTEKHLIILAKRLFLYLKYTYK